MLAEALEAPPPSHVRLVARPHELSAIRSAAVNLCVWERALPAELAAACAAACAAEPFDRRRVFAAGAPGLARLVEPIADERARVLLLRDLALLCSLHRDLSGAQWQDVTLGVVSGDSCRRFHTDNVGLRLLCTYAGPGTEWVPDDVARREHLGCSARCTAEASSSQGAPPEVRRLAVGHVGVFKGELLAPGGGAIVHRSPPIAGTGLRRLFLRIDAAARP